MPRSSVCRACPAGALAVVRFCLTAAGWVADNGRPYFLMEFPILRGPRRPDEWDGKDLPCDVCPVAGRWRLRRMLHPVGAPSPGGRPDRV